MPFKTSSHISSAGALLLGLTFGIGYAIVKNDGTMFYVTSGIVGLLMLPGLLGYLRGVFWKPREYEYDKPKKLTRAERREKEELKKFTAELRIREAEYDREQAEKKAKREADIVALEAQFDDEAKRRAPALVAEYGWPEPFAFDQARHEVVTEWRASQGLPEAAYKSILCKWRPKSIEAALARKTMTPEQRAEKDAANAALRDRMRAGQLELQAAEDAKAKADGREPRQLKRFTSWVLDDGTVIDLKRICIRPGEGGARSCL